MKLSGYGVMARENCGLLVVSHTVPVSRDVLSIHCARLSFSLQPGQADSCCDLIINSCHLQLIVGSCKNAFCVFPRGIL